MNSMFQVTYAVLVVFILQYRSHFRYGTTTVTHTQEKLTHTAEQY